MTSSGASGSLKIGTLLLQAELVKEQDLQDLLQMAKRMKLPLGRVMVGQGLLTEDTLNAALAAQSLLRDKMVSHQIVVNALKMMAEKGISFEEALRQFGLHSDHLEFTAKLGQLLVDSGLITPAKRNEALQSALAAGLPIGRVLVLKGTLSNLFAYAALSAQVMIRANHISREQAVQALKIVKTKNCNFETGLKITGYLKSQFSNKIMLGELLIISDQISEIDFLTTLENSLINDLPLGTVLLEAGLITQDKLDRTLDVQKKITAGQMTAAGAADYLQRENEIAASRPAPYFSTADLPKPTQSNVNAYPSVNSYGNANVNLKSGGAGPAQENTDGAVDLADLLIYGKLITHTAVNSAQAEADRTGLRLEQVLLARDLVDWKVVETAKRCLVLHSMNTISAEEAILSFHAWLADREQHIDEVLSRITQRDLG